MMGFRNTDTGGGKDGKQAVHPIWRGVGCFMALLIPVIAFTAALILIDLNAQNHWVTYPADFIASGKDPMLYIKIGATAVLSFILYIIFMLITFFVNGAFGPKRYGPTDAPQQKYKGGSYKR